ncbi:MULTISPECIES: hypothetical protein [Streptomyces]|uniref:Minor tail protein n=1 Tax=Streptomyces mordarskii TaxID=1226758 RepID=A0ABN1DFQ1_9ACTN
MAIPGNFLSTVTESIDPNTFGWKAKLNAMLSLGTGGRNGDGCLVVKSSAAGEMQAITVSSYPVTPWTEYEAFCDAAGVVGERIGIRWLNSSNAEISITWSMTTSPASAGWHRIAVGGEAPADAARAQIVVSSTPVAGNVNQYYENVYFGYPYTTTGNLFAFNTESAEVDASGWFAEVNCTIARQLPPVQWAVDDYLHGGHVMAMTAMANGNASIRSTDRPVATPGVEYMAACYLNPPNTSVTTWVELRFYDEPGNQIQATRSVLAAPGTAWYRQRASAVAPVGTAACSIAAGIDLATAGQNLRIQVIGQVTAGGRTMTRGVRWYDASNADLGVSTAAPEAAPIPGWWALSNDFTIPADATQAAIEYTLTATATGSVWRIDMVGMWQQLPANAVAAHDDTASITLTLRELTVGQLLTIYRVLPDGSRTLVRGLDVHRSAGRHLRVHPGQ